MSTWESVFPAGSGGNLPYPSGVPHNLRRMYISNNASSGDINRDYLIAFTARSNVTINRVWWVRANTTAANVFVGIYSATGTLLTDCAVDANTVAGVHEVTTTNVNLVAGQLYYVALNQSVLVAVSNPVAIGDVADQINYMLSFSSLDVRIHSSVPVHNNTLSSVFKDRTAALMPATQTMTGWTAQALAIYGGFTPI